MNLSRCSGVLLHPTSLSSPWGVGDIGQSAYRFVDLLQEAKQAFWQILPLTPVAEHGSPYSPHSLFAGNPLLLSPERLVTEGYLEHLPSPAPFINNERTVDFAAALEFKDRVVDKSFQFSYGRVKNQESFETFRSAQSSWLEDFAIYDAIAKEQGRPWYEWPEDLRRRERSAMEGKRSLLAPFIEKAIFSQYLFEEQWSDLLNYARSRGVRMLGDVPFYVQHDSVDIWAHRTYFKVDQDGKPSFVGGVPPDYFSETGQRWGNPVYDWGALEKTGYRWWNDRIRRCLELADLVRLDHFRGYVAYWEIPAEEGTAVKGNWVHLPGDFLSSLKQTFPALPFVAEDLGEITQDVKDAMGMLELPGMSVLQFGFDGTPDNPHFPPNHQRNSFVYTGTHDTNTVRGWFTGEADPRARSELSKFLGHEANEATVSRDFIAMAMESVADVSIIPMQDILGLGEEARMNNPATATGNWRWRAVSSEFSRDVLRPLGEQTASAGRC